ncbi:hypothetical protein [Sandarakinorhabdus oryzae]|uniref:hypothetical protein n=1 Tax=Sandarakinorhabdus oryzae TaxID=2675220 RepID=UPI0012E2D27F|nr:hypothetical protein [Sandarakinorhabdus oryzae]
MHGDVYADMMVALSVRWPQDNLLAVMAAEAIMSAQPWDYWEADGITNKGRAATAIALAETVLARAPNDPQAIHLLIHLTEASGHPERAAAAAARLEGVAPAAPHMVHMPSHTWYRLGRFADSVAANQRAIAADEAYARAVGAEPRFYGYFNHHTHFILSSAMQLGDRATALAAATALEASLTPDKVAGNARAEMRRLSSTQARLHFMTQDEVLAMPEPDGRLALTRILWRGARAEALASKGQIGAATAELKALRSARTAFFRPGRSPEDTRQRLIAMIDGSAQAHLLAARGDTEAALRLYQSLETVEARLPYSEPPLWPIPIAVRAGELRLAQGDKAGAAADFRRALALRPGLRLAAQGLANAG